ncbi:unnamed protein product [Rotaria sordida]|uniref:Uncharacterized protein n=1 Tax=Rotaria sordida TaxID=392033 RepID=A0A819BUA0_9BILA|nr:unnamed protein product [Rotaria sordida]CAF1372484.1 unnamed protein product [Rotaria sordida]CAF3800293.1 unnamed protein product [Rotaria sordida]
MAYLIFTRVAVLCILLLSSYQVGVAMMEEKFTDPYATVYIYSGRPNPRWQLSLEEWQQVNQLIQTLPNSGKEIEGPYQFSGGLGYTGFYAHFSIVSSYPDIYYVAAHKQAVLSNPGGHFIFNDKCKLVEQWFIDSAKSHGIQLPLLN